MVAMNAPAGTTQTTDRRFNKARFATTLRNQALPPYGHGKCAHYVRIALTSAGLDTTNAPVPAKDYGPFLGRLGFNKISPIGYSAQIGDVIVIGSIAGHPNGHVEGWDGSNWISDFIQSKLYPSRSYEQKAAAYEIYRR